MRQNTHNFRSGDLCKLLEIKRHVLRGLLDLAPLSSRGRTRRSATPFSAMDALFLIVINRLHTLGLAPKALQDVSAAVYEALQHPVAAGSDDVLCLTQSTDGCLAVGALVPGGEVIGITIPLRPMRRQLLRYTGADQIVGQPELALLGQLPGVPMGRAGSASRRSRS